MASDFRPVIFLSVSFLVILLAGCMSTGVQKPAPLSHYGQNAGAGSAGNHTVVQGDTLSSIAQRYRLAIADIVAANNLRSPFMLDVGQRLRLPPPRTYQVRPGDTLYEVSRLFGVTTSGIARQNNLQPPYGLTPGQVLRLPSAGRVFADASPAKFSSASPVPHANQPVSVAGAPSPVERSDLPPPATRPETKTASVPESSAYKPVRSSSPPVKPGEAPPRAGKFIRPVAGKVISAYGPKPGGLHNDGMNIAASRGAPVQAAENGVVVYAGSDLKGFGNLVLIRHQDRWMTAYAHLDRIGVQRGDVVTRGQAIGGVGSTGSVDRPQLHFELRRGTQALNPEGYL